MVLKACVAQSLLSIEVHPLDRRRSLKLNIPISSPSTTFLTQLLRYILWLILLKMNTTKVENFTYENFKNCTCSVWITQGRVQEYLKGGSTINFGFQNALSLPLFSEILWQGGVSDPRSPPPPWIRYYYIHECIYMPLIILCIDGWCFWNGSCWEHLEAMKYPIRFPMLVSHFMLRVLSHVKVDKRWNKVNKASDDIQTCNFV